MGQRCSILEQALEPWELGAAVFQGSSGGGEPDAHLGDLL